MSVPDGPSLALLLLSSPWHTLSSHWAPSSRLWGALISGTPAPSGPQVCPFLHSAPCLKCSPLHSRAPGPMLLTEVGIYKSTRSVRTSGSEVRHVLFYHPPISPIWDQEKGQGRFLGRCFPPPPAALLLLPRPWMSTTPLKCGRLPAHCVPSCVWATILLFIPPHIFSVVGLRGVALKSLGCQCPLTCNFRASGGWAPWCWLPPVASLSFLNWGSGVG